MVEAAAGGGAGDWPLKSGPPDGSLLAARATRRCPARGVVRSRLQPALADAGDAAPGVEGAFIAAGFRASDCGRYRTPASWCARGTVGEILRRSLPRVGVLGVNFAGATISNRISIFPLGLIGFL